MLVRIVINVSVFSGMVSTSCVLLRVKWNVKSATNWDCQCYQVPCNFAPHNRQRSNLLIPLVIHHSLFSNPSIRYTRSAGKILSLYYNFLSNIILSFLLSVNLLKVQMFFLFCVWLRAMYFIPSAHVVTYVDVIDKSLFHFVWLG